MVEQVCEMNILLVEDDEDIAELTAWNLERQGWQVSMESDGAKGWESIRTRQPDLVILDIMLPGMDGLSIARHMQENEGTTAIPIIFLTARAQLEDRLEGLSLGAADYLTKPFSPKELVLRVRNLFDRRNRVGGKRLLRRGVLVVDKDTMFVSLRGERLDLTPAEFKLLSFLAERPNKVQDRYELQRVLFGYADTTQSRAIDTHVKRLRQKLGEYAHLIGTERGVGYVFCWSEVES